MTEAESRYVFDQCQIGRSLRPLAQHGHVVIDDGTLALLDSKQQVIASTPLAEVTAHKIRFTRGQSLSLTVGGQKYNVSPGWGRYAGGFILPGDTNPVKNAVDALPGLIERGQ